MADGLSFRPDKFSDGQDIERGIPRVPTPLWPKETVREMAILVTYRGTRLIFSVDGDARVLPSCQLVKSTYSLRRLRLAMGLSIEH